MGNITYTNIYIQIISILSLAEITTIKTMHILSKIKLCLRIDSEAQ